MGGRTDSLKSFLEYVREAATFRSIEQRLLKAQSRRQTGR
jgi:hypothetical protein